MSFPPGFGKLTQQEQQRLLLDAIFRQWQTWLILVILALGGGLMGCCVPGPRCVVFIVAGTPIFGIALNYFVAAYIERALAEKKT